MPRVALPIIDQITPYPVVPIVINSLDFVFTAADVANGNDFPHTGRELILVQNSDAANPYTFTVLSAADPQGRVGDAGPYTMQANEFARFGPLPATGWKQADGKVWLAANNAAIKFAIVRMGSIP